MTVAELIELLRQQNPDRVVYAQDGRSPSSLLPVARLNEHWGADGILVDTD